MKAHKVIALVLKRDGQIVPAFLSGTFFQGSKVTTELARRCRDLRKSGHLKTVMSFPFSTFEATKKGEEYFKSVLK